MSDDLWLLSVIVTMSSVGNRSKSVVQFQVLVRTQLEKLQRVLPHQ